MNSLYHNARKGRNHKRQITIQNQLLRDLLTIDLQVHSAVEAMVYMKGLKFSLSHSKYKFNLYGQNQRAVAVHIFTVLVKRTFLDPL